jgi:hypothetical protein
MTRFLTIKMLVVYRLSADAQLRSICDHLYIDEALRPLYEGVYMIGGFFCSNMDDSVKYGLALLPSP